MPLSVALRVLTLNLLHEPESWPDRAPLVEAELLALAPDVVLLQEVAWPNEQATALAAVLGEHTGHPYAVHLTAVIVPDRRRPGRQWQEGLAVLSRFPVLATEEPEVAGAVHVCQRVRLDMAGAALDIYNLHLDPYAPEGHQPQLAALLAWVDRYPDAAGIVLGGDLNAAPDSAAVTTATTRLRSAYAAVHGHEPDHTSPTPFGLRRRKLAGRRLDPLTVDYLFVSPHVEVTKAERTFATPAVHDSLLYPSDHYGLIADLTLRWHCS